LEQINLRFSMVLNKCNTGVYKPILMYVRKKSLFHHLPDRKELFNIINVVIENIMVNWALARDEQMLHVPKCFQNYSKFIVSFKTIIILKEVYTKVCHYLNLLAYKLMVLQPLGVKICNGGCLLNAEFAESSFSSGFLH